MKNWRTTVTGVLGGISIFLYDFLTGLQAGKPFDPKALIIGLVLVILGIVAKDFSTTGGTVASTPEAVDRIAHDNITKEEVK